MSNAVWKEIQKAAHEAPKMYFAPLVGAISGISAQYTKLGTRAGQLLPKKEAVKPFLPKKG